MTARNAGVAAALALPFVPFLLGVPVRFDAPGVLLVGAAAVGAPGAAAALAWGRRRAADGFAAFVLGGWLLGFLALALRKALGLPLTPAGLAAPLGALTLLTAAVGLRRHGAPSLAPRGAAGLALASAALAFALAYTAARHIVPPLQDQDMDAQNTAYGLAARLTPFGLTDRSTLYFFAHPLYLHWLNAETLVLTGEIGTVRPPYDAARKEEAKQPPDARRPSVERALRALRFEERPPDRGVVWTRDVYGDFLRDPALFGTRAPNVALAAAFGALLLLSLLAIGLGRGDAALVAAASLTLPEVVVRLGYGGYFAPEALTFLLVARVACDPEATRAARAAAGFVAMFTSQKAIAAGAAAAGSEILARLRALPAGAAGSVPILAGMAVAAGGFALFGLVIAPEDFVLDNLLEHGFRRFAAAAGQAAAVRLSYPGPLEVWTDFARQAGPAFAATALAGWLAAPVLARRAGGSAEARSLAGVCFLWAAAGAVLFTATDWRQTKHLCTMLPAFMLLAGAALANAPGILRHVVRAALAGSIVWNVVRILRLLRDFDSFPVRPIW